MLFDYYNMGFYNGGEYFIKIFIFLSIKRLMFKII